MAAARKVVLTEWKIEGLRGLRVLPGLKPRNEYSNQHKANNYRP